MGARTKARKRAIDLLYGADLREISLNAAIALEADRAKSEPDRWNSWVYARTIVEGIGEHGDEIDELIETYAQGWTINRMPVTDRAIVRIGIWELLFNDDIRLERVMPNNGRPIIITSQPFIKGVKATQPELDELMVTKGYEKLTDGAYYDEPSGLLVFDLFPRNAFHAADGQIYPIDPVIQRILPDFGQFLREHPNTINLR